MGLSANVCVHGNSLKLLSLLFYFIECDANACIELEVIPNVFAWDSTQVGDHPYCIPEVYQRKEIA